MTTPKARRDFRFACVIDTTDGGKILSFTNGGEVDAIAYVYAASATGATVCIEAATFDGVEFVARKNLKICDVEFDFVGGGSWRPESNEEAARAFNLLCAEPSKRCRTWKKAGKLLAGACDVALDIVRERFVASRT